MSKIEKETIECPDCGFEIEYGVKRYRKGTFGPVSLRPVIVMNVPGACPKCGACLK